MARIFVLAVLAALLVPPSARAAPDVPHPDKHGAPKHAVPPKPPAHKPVPVVRPQHSAAHPPTAASPPVIPAPPAAAPPSEPAKGSNTGLLLPRFASLKTDEVNFRSGPGLRYPIEWVYKRRDLPVEIQREFEVWRLVADADGNKGWVHAATLTGRRTFAVRDAEQTIRDDARPDATPVARLKPGVLGRIRACEAKADWCQVQVGEYRGWLPRTAFWGTYPGEAIQ